MGTNLQLSQKRIIVFLLYILGRLDDYLEETKTNIFLLNTSPLQKRVILLAQLRNILKNRKLEGAGIRNGLA